MKLEYRYSIAQDESSDFIVVKPIYGDDVTSELERESGQQFFRRKLSGKFRFQGNDYEMINTASFDTVFNVKIELKYTPRLNADIEWYHYLTARFMKIDCDFNLDDKNIVTPFEVVDEYNDVMAGLEKEYDLMQLATEKENLTIQKRPLLQIYSPGDKVLSCFLGGSTWEQDCKSVPDANTLIDTYGFFATDNISVLVLGNYPSSYEGLGGVYRGRVTGNIEGHCVHTNGLYYIERRHTVEWVCRPTPSGEVCGEVKTDFRMSICRMSDKEELFRGEIDSNYNSLWGSLDYTMSKWKMTSTGRELPVTYSRYLLNTESFGGRIPISISGGDMTDNNPNYNYAIGIDVGGISISNETSGYYTKYGQAPDGLYYEEPDEDIFYPIGQSMWGEFSIWYIPKSLDTVTVEEEKGRSSFSISTYTISGVIKTLLNKVTPSITHESTLEYSEFLYGKINPISKDVKFTLLIQPKGILLRRGQVDSDEVYDISLDSIFKMLRDVYKCYWYIESGKLKIEHIDWFNNGGSYNREDQQTATDLTTYMCTSAKKPWGFSSRKFSYDKEDMPERFNFKWQDDVSRSFTGSSIEILSNYVKKGQIEEVSISDFTTDVDYVLLNPSSTSKSGFVLFAAINSELPFIEQTFEGKPLFQQNGLLSWVYLHQKYWAYDLPAKQVRINGEEVMAKTVMRVKTQTVKYPTAFDVDPQKLVHTYLGQGRVDKSKTTIGTRMNEVTLKYETEDGIDE